VYVVEKNKTKSVEIRQHFFPHFKRRKYYEKEKIFPETENSHSKRMN